MKKNLCFILPWAAASALLFPSCGEDRTHEYLAKTEVDYWIEAQMRDIYLYYQEMPQLEMEDYFDAPEDFFPRILASQDDYSYIVVPGSEEALATASDATYGFDFVLTDDPTGTSRQVARVLLVSPQSPADLAGLKRGDFITQVDGSNVTSQNSDALLGGSGVTLRLGTLLPPENPEDVLPTWKEDTVEVALTAAVELESNPIFQYKAIDLGGVKAGYLAYNEFKKGRNETDAAYQEQLLQVFQWFKSQSVEEFILDLRYNPGGELEGAQLLATLLAPASCMGQEFARFVYNDKRQDLNYSLDFPTEYAAYNLDLDRLFVISGDYTAAAAEMLVNGLRPYMPVNLLGTRTAGQNVALDRVDSPYGFTMYPVTSTVCNKEGQSDYANGFTPEYIITELNYYPWYELGDPNELLLNNALQWMAGGIPSDAENVSLPETPETPEDPAPGNGSEDTGNSGETGEGSSAPTVRLSRAATPAYSSIRRKDIPVAVLHGKITPSNLNTDR